MAIISKIFSKKLRKTDVNCRLAVKTESLALFPDFQADQYAQDLYVEDEEGVVWHFRLAIRKFGRYKKPVLSSGDWLEFVRKKELGEGYEVTFLKEENEATGEVRFKIKLKKPYIVFGKEFGFLSYRPSVKKEDLSSNVDA